MVKHFNNFQEKYCGNLLTMWDLYKTGGVGGGDGTTGGSFSCYKHKYPGWNKGHMSVGSSISGHKPEYLGYKRPAVSENMRGDV